MKKNSILPMSTAPPSVVHRNGKRHGGYHVGAAIDAKVETRSIHPRQSAASSSTITRERQLQRMPTEEDINASAEAFIQKFRQQLLLQRMESIENYEKMVNTGH